MGNLGRIDRLARLMVALVLLGGVFGLGWGGAGALRWVLLAGAAMLLLTAALGRCPMYRMLGVGSCGRR